MVSWSGRRRTLTILLFILPTLLGVFVFSLYPIVFNTFISTTNRNQFHPNPNCAVGITSIADPTCWSFVGNKPPKGLGTPYTIRDPFYANYVDLIGRLFTAEAVLALVRILIALAPLYVARVLNRRFDRELSRPVSSFIVWLGAIFAVAVLGLLVDLPGAVGTLTGAGDFFLVNLRTVLYVLLNIPLFFILGLTLALVLNSPNLPGRTFFRVILIIPWAASTVAIMMSLVWQFFFRQQGTINQILAALMHIQGPAFLNNIYWAWVAIVIANVWYTYPFFMTVILGALQSIPAEQYEAAEVDGATYWDKLMKITLPLLRPAVLPVVVLSSITTFQMFGTVWAITQGGPTAGAGAPGGTELVMVYAYKQVFQTAAYGRMGAFAVIIFILLFAATLYSLRMTRLTQGA